MSDIIGKKLKHLRLSRKLTQQEVSDRINGEISRSTISNYEIGRRTPHLLDLQKMADLFGVTLDYFGVKPKDDAFDVLARAKEVFENDSISKETKEDLYMEFMKMYINLKGEANEKKEEI